MAQGVMRFATILLTRIIMVSSDNKYKPEFNNLSRTVRECYYY